MKTNIYPNVKAADWKHRLKVAWRILRHGEYFPAPLDWYGPLYPIVSDEYSSYAEQAVMKAEKEFGSGSDNQELKRREALQWMMHYANAAGKSTNIQMWKANFLIEWWVARKKGRF